MNANHGRRHEFTMAGIPVGRLYDRMTVKKFFPRKNYGKLLLSNQKTSDLKSGRIVGPSLLSWRLMRRWMLANWFVCPSERRLGWPGRDRSRIMEVGILCWRFPRGIASRITQKIQPLS